MSETEHVVGVGTSWPPRRDAGDASDAGGASASHPRHLRRGRGVRLSERVIRRGSERLICHLPPGQAAVARHHVRRRMLERFLAQRLGASYRPLDPGVAPPVELVAQTSVLHERDLPAAAERNGYLAGGYLGALHVLEMVERFGFDIAAAGAILDFGCGAAKNTRLLRGIQGLRLVGTDVNPGQIEWAREHLSGIEFHVNSLEPPLAFAQDDSFDLVIAASVFTHIPLQLQGAWLEEICRVLRPGGYFFCTVAGAYHVDIQLTHELRQRLRSEGHVTLTADDAGVSHATKAAGSWDVFQTRQEVLRSFGKHYEILHHSDNTSAGAQDDLILRKSAIPRRAGGSCAPC